MAVVKRAANRASVTACPWSALLTLTRVEPRANDHTPSRKRVPSSLSAVNWKRVLVFCPPSVSVVTWPLAPAVALRVST